MKLLIDTVFIDVTNVPFSKKNIFEYVRQNDNLL